MTGRTKGSGAGEARRRTEAQGEGRPADGAGEARRLRFGLTTIRYRLRRSARRVTEIGRAHV